MNKFPPCACGCGQPVRTPNGTWLRGHNPGPRRPALPLGQAVDVYLSSCRRVGDCLFGPNAEGHYGEMRYRTDEGRESRIAAHRAVYITRVGPIPLGQVVRHRCDNMSCAEPSHLLAGTQAQNIRDVFDRQRRSAPWKHGDSHPCAILTCDLVSELRIRAAAGAKLAALADEYGLNYLTMTSAIRGRTWRHVETEPVPGLPRSANTRALALTRTKDCARAAELAADGLNLAEIGAQFGVSRHTAFRLVRAGRGAADPSPPERVT